MLRQFSDLCPGLTTGFDTEDELVEPCGGVACTYKGADLSGLACL